MKKPRKFMRLKFSLLFKVLGLIIISFVITAFGSIHRARIYSRENSINLTEENLNEVLYIVANINSVLMQQMRIYTKFDPITSTNPNPKAIQKRLIEIAPQRYKDFITISYVDYNTCFEYFDNGKVEDCSNKGYFLKLADNRLKHQKKADQMYTDEIEPDIYGICKEADIFDNNNYTVGCFIGRVSIDGYIQRFLNKLKGDRIDSPKGFPVILSSDLNFICAPQKDFFSDKNLASFEVSDDVVRYVLKPIEKDENGKKKCVSGDIKINGKLYSISVGLFSKTSWTLGIITPYSTFNNSSTKTVIFIVIYALVATVLSAFIIYFIFNKEFKPLNELAASFKLIASGDADLTKRLDGKMRSSEIGEIQAAFNEYITNLQGMIKDVYKTKEDLLKKTNKLTIILGKVRRELVKLDDGIKDNVDIKELDTISANIDLLFPELEEITKEIYHPVGKLSSIIDGFKFE